MADKNSGWSCTTSASIISETNTTATIRVYCYWTTGTWKYNINYVNAWVYLNGTNYQVMSSGSVNASAYNTSYSLGYYDFTVNKTTSSQSIPYCAKITSNSTYVSGTKWSGDQYITVGAKPSYSITYNANGGSSAPANQTKWYGTNITLSTTKPTRTGYTFSKWNTNSSGTGTSYNPGATYSNNANLTLYAIWTANTYTVSYNANGGSGAPSSQTKTYGTNLTLSSTKPTRTNYTFKGWSTSSSGSVVYAAGGTYTSNSSVTLYAVWELAYIKPSITNFKAVRCDSAGTTSDSGTYIKVTFDWSVFSSLNTLKIEWKEQSAPSWSSVYASSTTSPISQIVGSGTINIEKSYYVRAFISDSTYSTTYIYSNTVTVGSQKFPIDVKDGGTGVAIGKVAEENNIFDVGYAAKFRADVIDRNSNELRADVYDTYANDSSFNDVKNNLIGSAYRDRRPYIVGNAPINDNNYIQKGISHVVLGMEYSDAKYGSQLSMGCAQRMLFRSKWDGSWGYWYEVMVSRLAYTQVGTAGWYRVATFDGTGHGRDNNSIILQINTNYSYTPACSIIIAISTAYRKARITQLNAVDSADNHRVLTHVRVRYDSSAERFFVDVYYTKNVSNELTVRNLTPIYSNVTLVEPILDTTATVESVVDSLEVDYTGSNIRPKIVLNAIPTDRISITGTAWTNTFIPLDTRQGLDLSDGKLSISDGGIKIGNGVTKILASASVSYFEYNNTGEVDFALIKNSTVYTRVFGCGSIAGQLNNMTTNSIPIDVTAGDVIKIAINKSTANPMTILAGNGATSLTVEVIG